MQSHKQSAVEHTKNRKYMQRDGVKYPVNQHIED